MAGVSKRTRNRPAIDVAESWSMEALRTEWQRLFCIEALPRISRELLVRGVVYRLQDVGYHLQEEAEGGLSKRVVRQLRDAVPNGSMAVGPTGTGDRRSNADGSSIGEPSQAALNNRESGTGPQSRLVAMALKPGTRLVREWQGRAHEVIVLADGYLWKGERYGSLSVIAGHITGAHWSGPRFFGTRKTVSARSQAGGTGVDAGAAKERRVAGVEAGGVKERRVAGVEASAAKERRAAGAARTPIASSASAPKAGSAIHRSGSDA